MLLEEIVSSEEARARRGGEEARGRGEGSEEEEKGRSREFGKIFKIL